MRQSQTNLRRRLPVAVALLALPVALSLVLAHAQAQPAAPPKFEATKFTQIKRDAAGKPLALQKAIVRYVPTPLNKAAAGLSVDLVGVVHIADKKFYEQLNTIFKDYDAVLWEGVKGQPKNKLLAEAMKALLNYQSPAEKLDLVTQSKHIDYRAPNFVHADVTYDEWGERIKKNDDWMTLSLSLAADVYNLLKTTKVQPAAAATTDPLAKKIQMAESFAKNQNSKELGQTLHKLLIELRNDACTDVLTRQIAAGKKKIAIFYGSAHMPDFERRLLQDFGMQRQSVIWLDAWDLTPKAVASPAAA